MLREPFAPRRAAVFGGQRAALVPGAILRRMFAYGSLAVVLVLYLHAVGLTESRIGALLTLTLLGDTAISLWLTSHADRWGRRRT